uniref:PC4 domain-containing protein n=1 Tax=Haemonchus contortus TaxID=6289 RepID=A0A7I4XVQ5_HAECO
PCCCGLHGGRYVLSILQGDQKKGGGSPIQCFISYVRILYVVWLQFYFSYFECDGVSYSYNDIVKSEFGLVERSTANQLGEVALQASDWSKLRNHVDLIDSKESGPEP